MPSAECGWFLFYADVLVMPTLSRDRVLGAVIEA